MRLITYDGVRYLLTSQTNEALEDFHKQLPQIKADINNMKESQLGEQKWFHRLDSWDINEVYGAVTVKVFSKSYKEKKYKEIEQVVTSFSEYPIPVYELVAGTSEAPLLARFWFALTGYWQNPTASQKIDPPVGDRRSVDIVEETYGTAEVFPLNRIGETIELTIPGTDRRYWSEEDTHYSTTQPDVVWTPGMHDNYNGYPWLPNPPWNNPLTAYDYIEAGTGFVIKACDASGEILQSDNMAHLSEVLSSSGGPIAIFIGDYAPYSRPDYMFHWETTFGYWTSNMGYYMPGLCPFVVSESLTIYDNASHSLLKQTGDRVSLTNSSNSISINGEFVVSGASNGIEDIKFTWGPLSIAGAVALSYITDEPSVLNDAATYGQENWNDFEAWCVVYETNIENNEHSLTVINSDSPDAKWNETYATQRSELTYPGTYKISAKVAGVSEEFVIFEAPYEDSIEFSAECAHCEIYEFYKEPVYIFSVHIYKEVLEVGTVIYAMIYGRELFLSDEFETDSIDEYTATIYESVSEWGLKGHNWARAAGVRQTIKSTELVVMEDL